MEPGWTMEQLIRDVGQLSRLMMQLAEPEASRANPTAAVRRTTERWSTCWLTP
jgi:hypothetical protein